MSDGVDGASTQDCEEANSTNSQVSVIEEPPIPTSVEDAAEFQADHPSFDELEEPLHPDELYERYVEVLVSTHEWRVYEVRIHGFENEVYIWNHQAGHGIQFTDCDGSFQSFVQAMALLEE